MPEKGEAAPIFRGPTRILDLLAVHASILDPGCCPHPPHTHPEEELLMVLDGEAEIVLADDPAGTNMRLELGRPGRIFYYPPQQHQNDWNPASRPVTYLMFKWRAGLSAALNQLGTSIFALGVGMAPDERKGYKTATIFQQPTVYLTKLQAHLTTMLPGAGYEPHVDAYDVAILVLSGKLETLGEIVEPHSVIFYSAGEPHGMRNVGQEPTRYLVFEFHGAGSSQMINRARDHKLEPKSALKEKLEVTSNELKASRAQIKRLEGTLLRQSQAFEKKLEVKRSELKASRAQAKQLENALLRQSSAFENKLEIKKCELNVTKVHAKKLEASNKKLEGEVVRGHKQVVKLKRSWRLFTSYARGGSPPPCESSLSLRLERSEVRMGDLHRELE